MFALQGNLEAAHREWQKGLVLCQNDNVWERSVRALYTVALGEPNRGIAELQAIVEAGAPMKALRNVLGDAEVLARCPAPPAGIDTVVALLKEAIDRL